MTGEVTVEFSLSLKETMRSTPTSCLIDQLRDALRRPLPGPAAQVLMSPDPRPGAERILDPDPDCRHAGVLALLYPSGGDLCLVLTLRTESVESHRGQISFPGGAMDPGEIPEETALREAHEELGINPAGLDVLGELSPLYIPHSGFYVHPVVAYAADRPAFVPNPEEVAEVIEAPVSLLLAPDTCCEEVWRLRGAPARVPFYAIGPHKVWGATAMMLSELMTLLKEQ